MTGNKRERRNHPRSTLTCWLQILDPAGDDTTVECRNVCDGGVLAFVPAEVAPAPDAQLDVQLAVPRSTANTYMIERFTCRTHVVRHEHADGNGAIAVAMRFGVPLELALEV